MTNNIDSSLLRAGYSELRAGLAHIGYAGYEFGAAQVKKGCSYARVQVAPVCQAVVPYVQKAVAVAAPVLQKVKAGARPCAEALYNRGCYELQEVAKGGVDAYNKSREVARAGVAKVDRVFDRKLSQTTATVAKRAVRLLPSAALTAGMLAFSYPLSAGMVLLGAAIPLIGKENTGNGAGFGCIAAGAVHFVTSLTTGGIGALALGVIEVAGGMRLLRGNGLVVPVHNGDAIAQPAAPEEKLP